MIQVDGEPQPGDSTALSPHRNSTARCRVLFHEAVHYWQQLSQGFLIKLADEEWAQLQAYEDRQELSGPGPVRREFERQHPGSGYSARHLHECLARYWEIMAFGPANVIRHEWQLDRAAAHRDFQEAWKGIRRSSGAPAEASGFVDLHTAMMMIGGEYAAPFMEACNRFGEAGTFVFPWLAHLALTTDRPADSYATLTEKCGQQMADDAREMLTDSQTPIDERYESTMLRLATTAHTALLETLPGNSMLGLTAYSRSQLATNPSHAAAFQRMLEAARVVATAKTVREIARRWGWDQGSKEGPFIEGLHLLEKLMATPGMYGSRPLLQLTGLAPAIGYSNGDFLPMGMAWRASGLAEVKKLSEETLDELDLVRALMNLSSRRATTEDRLVAVLSAETQARWDSFVQADRRADRHQRER
jgi:hypothetical protein